MADDGPRQAPDDGVGQGLRGRDLVGLGGLLAGAVVVGLVAGFLLDRAVGTEPVFTLIGIFLGIVAAAVGFWVRVRDALGG